MPVTEAQVRDLVVAPLKNPETVWILSNAHDPMDVATVVAAFANGAGGTLVIGYFSTGKFRANRYRLTGVDPTATLEGIRVALQAVEPTPDVETHVVEVDGRSVVVAEVKPSREFPVLAGGVPYYMEGGAIGRAPGEKFMARAAAAASDAEIRESLRAFASTMDRQVQVIEGLRGSWRVAG